MNKTTALIIAVVLLAAGLGGGYWLGSTKVSHGDTPSATAAPAGKKLLYYRNPMGLPDTSPVPKKDPMGMDYIPVYEGGDEAGSGDSGSGIKLSTEKVQKLGVRTEAATKRVLDKTVRAAGRVEVDERRVHAVVPKFEGWVERLHVNVTGQPVALGEPLFEVYSPELVSAQREYQVAARGLDSLKGASNEAQAGMRGIADAALVRLANWDISDEQVKALAAGAEPRRTLTFRSPANGIVLEKKALAGMRFMAGESLYQVADLSAVWVVADVFEQDIALVKQGRKARVRINAYPDKEFEGTITYVYPTLKPETRTIPVRLELANPGGLLKPAMFAQVELSAAGRGKLLTVPSSAVINTGTRHVVLVQTGEGSFEPRDIKPGAESDDYVEVREGVKDGEQVVVAANFLIDAESNLKAALGGMEKPKATAGHQAVGTLDAIEDGTVSITHEPVASLGWPAMTMEFIPANPALFSGVKPGSHIAFEFVERSPGEWVVTKVEKRH
ncbi:MAG: efflux RND transporter periplasmic adaptor subunit [Rhodocyclales bacterium]|nr:efflux RND transporter periplasmic adaptor subunit [Rhodocyclales bacterium]